MKPATGSSAVLAYALRACPEMLPEPLPTPTITTSSPCGDQASAGFEPVSNAQTVTSRSASAARQDLASLRRPGGQQLQVDIIGVQERAQPQQLHCGRQLARQLLQAEQPSPGYDSRGSSPLTLAVFLVILLTMTVLPLGEVKSHLSELVGRVHDHHERVTVTVHGRPSAILIAPEDLEALEETLEIMRDAATMNRLAESDAELARGEYVSAEELAEAMRRRRAR